MEEFRQAGLISSGGPKMQWESMLGRPVSEREFYEYQLYKPSEICPYVEKIYAVILVSRNRDNENCYVQWKPNWSHTRSHGFHSLSLQGLVHTQDRTTFQQADIPRQAGPSQSS